MRLDPSDARECASALRSAAEAGRTVRVRGSGTKADLGGADAGASDSVLRTRGLHGIIDHVPADLTVTVRAGTRLRDVQAALAERGQFLPLDPPHDEATIGGVVAANSNGFGALRYGAVRDLLIGTTTALTNGTLAHAGGRVVKNVAGYDLNKLLVGSFGTLGVIVEATFRVLPLPVARGAAVSSAPDGVTAFARAAAIVRTSIRPSALVVDRERGVWRLVVAAAGEQAVVDRTLREADGDHVADPEQVLAPLRDLPATAAEGALVRATLPLAAQAPFAEGVSSLDGFARLVADAGTGIARVHLLGDDATVAASAAAAIASARVLGGSARAERLSPSLRAVLAALRIDPPGYFLMRRLKDAFDPRGILEPGSGPA